MKAYIDGKIRELEKHKKDAKNLKEIIKLESIILSYNTLLVQIEPKA